MTASGYDRYASIADLYDHVAPYRDRPDVASSWKRPARQKALCSRWGAEQVASSSPPHVPGSTL